jgi:hypothetical protein
MSWRPTIAPPEHLSLLTAGGRRPTSLTQRLHLYLHVDAFCHTLPTLLYRPAALRFGARPMHRIQDMSTSCSSEARRYRGTSMQRSKIVRL